MRCYVCNVTNDHSLETNPGEFRPHAHVRLDPLDNTRFVCHTCLVESLDCLSELNIEDGDME